MITLILVNVTVFFRYLTCKGSIDYFRMILLNHIMLVFNRSIDVYYIRGLKLTVQSETSAYCALGNLG